MSLQSRSLPPSISGISPVSAAVCPCLGGVGLEVCASLHAAGTGEWGPPLPSPFPGGQRRDALGACLRGSLTTLPASLSGLADLVHLDLSFNSLETLPACILQMRGLGVLLLSHNHLSELPAALGTLPALTFLAVTHNNLRALPAALGALSSLQRLDLSENLLDTLPPEIGGLSSLTELHLASNRLQSLPASLGKYQPCPPWLKEPAGEWRPAAAQAPPSCGRSHRPWGTAHFEPLLLTGLGGSLCLATGQPPKGFLGALARAPQPGLALWGQGGPEGSSAGPKPVPAHSGAALLAPPCSAQQPPGLGARWPGPPPTACPTGPEGQPAPERAPRAARRPLCALAGEPPGRGSARLPKSPR